MQFNYVVRSRDGKTQKGQLEAADEQAVVAALRERGYTPLSVEAAPDNSGLNTEIRIPGFGPKVKTKDLAVFSRQFATMISSGLTLLRTLTILERQTENDKLSEVLGEVRADVEGGASLTAALDRQHEHFPQLYRSMIKAGETAGVLDEVLERLAVTLEKDVALKAKIKSALTYPVIVLLMAFALTVVMLVFIVPTFAGMFASMGSELPLPTQVLMSASGAISSPVGMLTLFGTPFALRYGFRALKASPDGQLWLDKVKVRLPVFGTLFRKVAISRFARNFSVLTQAGVPILTALEITGKTSGNALVERALLEVRDSVEAGESLAGPLADHDIFPPMVVQMMAVGEETGAIDTMLDKMADFYDREVEAMTESLTALMEPLMIGLLGGIVGSMVVALYMPIFEIINKIEA